MGETKRVLVVCGTGLITSAVVVARLEELFRDAGISAEVLQGGAAEIPLYCSQGIDLIVTTVELGRDLPVPVVSGLALLTGVGDDEVARQILALLGTQRAHLAEPPGPWHDENG
ncbi:MAG TPA: PTS sugar transporter subunit IIB [Symbiobacteriaceae bacterium]